jgi:hypothetical protein
LAITETELKLIASAAIIGEIKHRKKDIKLLRGIPSTLKKAKQVLINIFMTA